MKREAFFALLQDIDQDLLEGAELAPPKRRHRWVWGLAACAVVAVLATLVLPWNGGVTTPKYPMLDPEVDPELISGEALAFAVGSSVEMPSGGSSEPPLFAFGSTGIVVEARAVACLPDVYYKPEERKQDVLPVAYRLFRCETMRVVHGEQVPEEFWYLLPERLYADLTRYDTLLISMTQLGTENYVIRNGTQSKMEVLQLPIFGDLYDNPHLGDMIAFTDGVFDESLWQTESWYYGYQFGKIYLSGNKGYPELVVHRGDTVEQVIEAVTAEINEAKQWLQDRYREPVVVHMAAAEAAAQETVAFVQPFANGVFSQKLETDYYGNTKIIYRRYINGCETEETVTVQLSGGEVTYSETRYTKEELAGMVNIGLEISRLSKEYAQQSPTPPCVDPDGKQLLGLNLYGWYTKAAGKPLGIIRTTWLYWETETGMYYLDVVYRVYDAEAETPWEASCEELTALIGHRNVYQGSNGEGFWAPGC